MPAVPPTPGFLPKAALTVARLAHKPFEVPAELSNTSVLVGGATHNLVGKSNAAFKESVEALQPRGPVKWLVGKSTAATDAAVGASMGKADRNVNVFWKPLAQGAETIGLAVTNPASAFYATRAGFTEITPELLAQLTHSTRKADGWPVPAPPADRAAATPAGAAPAQPGQPAAPPAADEPSPTPPGQPPAAPPADDGATPPAPQPQPDAGGGGEQPPTPPAAPPAAADEPAPQPQAQAQAPAQPEAQAEPQPQPPAQPEA